MKGITPIIAVILLLLITIAIVGFAFIWFNRVTSSATNFTESELSGLQQSSSKKIAIDSVDTATTNVSIRNIGTTTISSTEITFYKNGALKSVSGNACRPLAPFNIAPGNVVTCALDLPAASCTAGTTVKVTSPGNNDQIIC